MQPSCNSLQRSKRCYELCNSERDTICYYSLKEDRMLLDTHMTNATVIRCCTALLFDLRSKLDRTFGCYECTTHSVIEHIVHIDGVTGSSPVQTTINGRSLIFGLLFLRTGGRKMKCARQVKMWDLAAALRWISSYRDVFCVKISAANRSPSSIEE